MDYHVSRSITDVRDSLFVHKTNPITLIPLLNYAIRHIDGVPFVFKKTITDNILPLY